MEVLDNEETFGVKLDGCVYANNGANLSEEEFSNAFIEFIEERELCFGGGLYQVDEDGNYISDIK